MEFGRGRLAATSPNTRENLEHPLCGFAWMQVRAQLGPLPLRVEGMAHGARIMRHGKNRNAEELVRRLQHEHVLRILESTKPWEPQVQWRSATGRRNAKTDRSACVLRPGISIGVGSRSHKHGIWTWTVRRGGGPNGAKLCEILRRHVSWLSGYSYTNTRQNPSAEVATATG